MSFTLVLDATNALWHALLLLTQSLLTYLTEKRSPALFLRRWPGLRVRVTSVALVLPPVQLGYTVMP
jgi:hypothetical protein